MDLAARHRLLDLIGNLLAKGRLAVFVNSDFQGLYRLHAHKYNIL
jgi:hypothetical protein